MHILPLNHEANPNIGLFCYATNSYCLVPKNFKWKNEIQKTLNVPVIEINAAGTNLLGIFFSGNDKVLFVPEIMYENEIKTLKENNIHYEIINSRLTALGNNMIMNEHACIINEEYQEIVRKQIENSAQVIVKRGRISDLNTVGSFLAVNDKGFLVSENIFDYEMKFLERNLQVKGVRGTLNSGSVYIKSGVVVTNKGFLIGETSAGFEIQNADQAFGFI